MWNVDQIGANVLDYDEPGCGDEILIRIRVEQVEEYINQGWIVFKMVGHYSFKSWPFMAVYKRGAR